MNQLLKECRGEGENFLRVANVSVKKGQPVVDKMNEEPELELSVNDS